MEGKEGGGREIRDERENRSQNHVFEYGKTKTILL